MKWLAVAFGVALSLSLGMFLVVRFVVGLQGDAVEAISVFPLLTASHIYEQLEKQASRKAIRSGNSNKIVDLNYYNIRWPVLFFITLFVYAGLVQSISLYFGFISSATGVDFEVARFGLMELPLIILTSFLMGRWVGTRSSGFPVGSIILLAAIACVLSADRIAMTTFLVDDDDASGIKLLGEFGTVDFFMNLLGGITIYGVFGCVGVWRGTRLKMQKYFSYLLSVLPVASREVLISLAHEEVQSSQARQITQEALAVTANHS